MLFNTPFVHISFDMVEVCTVVMRKLRIALRFVHNFDGLFVSVTSPKHPERLESVRDIRHIPSKDFTLPEFKLDTAAARELVAGNSWMCPNWNPKIVFKFCASGGAPRFTNAH